MKQLNLLKSCLFMMLVMFASNVWGETVNFTMGSGKDVTSNSGATKSGITITATDGTSNANNWGGTTYVRLQAGGTIVITPSSATITSVVLNCTSGYEKTWSASIGDEPKTSTVNHTVTWSGSTTSAITLKNIDSAQARVSSIDVTYTTTTGGSTPATPYTVTFSDGGSITEETAGAGVTLPSRSQVGDYTFSGWCEQEVEETTTKPAIIEAGTYMPTKDITLYPVYQKSDGDAGGSETASATSGLNASTNAQTLEAGKPITYMMSASNNYSDPLRVYKGNTLTFAGATITKIVLTGEDNSYPATNLILAGNKKGSRTTSGNSVIWEGEETTVIFNASSAQARVSSIEVTYTTGSTQVTYYTSNPSGVTKTLQSDLSISGTYPTSFYVGDEFSSEGIVVKANYSDDSQVDVTSKVSFKGYNMNVAGNYEVTVEYTEKDVTASAKYNITVNEIPTYSVTIVKPENGSIIVMHNDIQVLTGDKFMQGEELNITATADEGYSFKNIKVTDNSDHEFTVNPKTWKMGASDITITANFEKIPVYTINWSVNGKIIQSDEILKGNPVVAPSVTVPAGTTKQFTGNWVTTPTVDAEATPAYVTLSIASEDVTYYAVFADVEEGSGETEYTLDNETIKNAYKGSGDGATTSYADRTIDGWSGKFIINTIENKHFVQINKSSNNYYLCSPTYESAISKVTINTTGGTSSTKTAAGRKFYLCANNETAQPSEGAYGEGAIAEDNGSVTINTTGDPTQFYLYTDGTARIASIVVTCGTAASYSDFTTLPYGYTREDLTKDNYGTLCLPNAVKAGDINGATVYSIAGVRKSGESVTSVVLEEVEGDLEAGTPYIFQATADKLVAAYTGEAVTEAVSATGLVGNLGTDNMDVPTDMYIIYNNQVRKAGTGVWVGANRAYIDLTSVSEFTSAPAGAKLAVLGMEGGVPTGINTIETAENGNVYNLQGVRVNNSFKGIVIENGRKVIRK